ncbi:MAG: hypothetical protein ACKVVP_04165 [Chloroflexota bacterium]
MRSSEESIQVLHNLGRAAYRLPVLLLSAVIIVMASTGAPPPAPASAEAVRASGIDVHVATRSPGQNPNLAPRNFANGQSLILNMHALLFHERPADVRENLEYAAWLNAGVVRVFSTDKIGHLNLTGREIGERIVEMAPLLRQHRLKLIVALMDQYREVPGDTSAPLGWMHGYRQLMLPFYSSTWRGSYREFLSEIILTVKQHGALDVIWAWELGNEIHTQENPSMILRFIDDVTIEIRRIDGVTPILPGTMGGGILDPGNSDSPIARHLFCEAPIHAYTLHTFDWWDDTGGGDVPIQWDLQHTTRMTCENGRALPVIVEELGTSRELPGVYRADEPWARLDVELRQIRRVLSYPSVSAIGVWSAESPHVSSVRHDLFRGLTSHQNDDGSSGSCYRPNPGSRPGTRCELELALRALPRLPDMAVVAQGYEASQRSR